MSKKAPQQAEFSIRLAEFVRLLNDALKDYNWSFEEVHRLDLLQNDYLHALELEELDYKHRASIATKIRNCRKERRRNKSITEILTPIKELLESQVGVEFMKQLNEVLGKTRKLEEKAATRVYCSRVSWSEHESNGDATH